MTTDQLIAVCRSKGYRLFPLPDGKLRVEPLPPPELLNVLRANKQQILEALRQPLGGSRMATGEAPAKLTLYVGRSGGQAWSRWPLDERYWSPEAN